MIFREDFGCQYEASNGRTGERKVRTHRAGSAVGTRSDAREELRQHAFRSLRTLAVQGFPRIVVFEVLEGEILTRTMPA